MRLPILILSMFASPVFASKIGIHTYSPSLKFAQATHVVATQNSSSCCFNTSARHNDQDWKHYVIGWQAIDFEGNQLDIVDLCDDQSGDYLCAVSARVS